MRLSGSLHVLYTAYQLVADYKQDIYVKIQNVEGMEDKLSDEYLDYIKKSKIDKMINLFHVTTAYGLNHYFINQKLILAGFPKAGETLENVNQLSKPVDSIERKILLYPGPIVFLTACSVNHICNKVEFQLVGKKLQALKLGTYGTRKLNSSSKASACFTKINPKDNKNESVEIINNLMGFFITYEDFEQAYDALEST